MKRNIWVLSGFVAVAGVVFKALRAEGDLAGGLLIVSACILCLMYKMCLETLAFRRGARLATSGFRKIVILLASGWRAFLIIGLSDLTFLIGYHGYLRVADSVILTSHATPSFTPGHMISGWIVGLLAALFVARNLERNLSTARDPEGGSHTGRSFRSWMPVVIVLAFGVALVMEHAWQRYAFCRMMAGYHEKVELEDSSTEQQIIHSNLSQWYKYTAIRPWLPVHPR